MVEDGRDGFLMEWSGLVMILNRAVMEGDSCHGEEWDGNERAEFSAAVG